MAVKVFVNDLGGLNNRIYLIDFIFTRDFCEEFLTYSALGFIYLQLLACFL